MINKIFLKLINQIKLKRRSEASGKDPIDLLKAK